MKSAGWGNSMDPSVIFGAMYCIVFLLFYGVGIFFTVRAILKKRRERNPYRHHDRGVAEQINMSDPLNAPVAALPDPDVLDWEYEAVNLLRDGRELGGIKIVRQQTGLDYEEAKVKLLKLNEELV